jgi:hypothetical protein
MTQMHQSHSMPIASQFFYKKYPRAFRLTYKMLKIMIVYSFAINKKMSVLSSKVAPGSLKFRENGNKAPNLAIFSSNSF